VTREDTVARTVARHLPVWSDPMNDDLALARVRMRKLVAPILRDENPQLDRALLRLAASAGEWDEAIGALALPFTTFPIDCALLAKQPAAVRKRALAHALERHCATTLGEIDAAHLDHLDAYVVAPTRGQVLIDMPGVRLVRSYDLLTPATPPRPPETDWITGVPAGYTVRVWRPGDRMRPARLRGRSRKLSDLFIDAKIPRMHRGTARVLLRDADNVIVWADFIGLAFGEPVHLAPTASRSVGSF